MKYLVIISLAWLIILESCSQNYSSKPISQDSRQSELNDYLEYSKLITIYKYDIHYKDSILICKLWYSGDSVIKKEGEFYYRIPMQSHIISNFDLEKAKGKSTYETFDSLICETGGHSAWNKYLFTYNEQDNVLKIQHYKAWYRSSDEEGNYIVNQVPQYFLGEESFFTYTGNTVTQKTYDAQDKKPIETIVKKYDNQSRLVLEAKDSWDTYRFKLFYTYAH